jgi:DNA-binding NarL/FixJ family response regulator
MNASDKTKIVCVSEPGTMQEALCSMLNALPHIAIVGHASGGLSALQVLSRCEAHVVVIDANVPIEETLALVQSLNALRPRVACIVLTAARSQQRLAVAGGASAALLRSSPSQQILDAIHAAARCDASH